MTVKIISALLVPSNFLALLIVLGAVLLFTPWRRAGRVVVATVAALFLIAGLSPLPEWGLRVLEDRFPPPRVLPARIDGIVVLGGDLNAEIAEKRPGYGLGSSGGGARTAGFAILARRYPSAKLVFSGGTGSLVSSAIEADAAARLLRDLGLPTSDTVFERGSRTTRENALFAANAAKPSPSENWLLVTSAYHMPRAVGAFRRLGWSVIAYPVGYLTRPNGADPPRIGVGRGLRLSDHLAHEVLGLIMYRISDYTDTLWPGP